MKQPYSARQKRLEQEMDQHLGKINGLSQSQLFAALEAEV